MKYEVVKYKELGLFKDGFMEIYDSVETRLGSLVCFWKTSGEVAITHIDKQLGIIDEQIIQTDGSQAQDVVIHQYEAGGYLISVNIRNTYEDNINDLDVMIIGFKPLWVDLKISEQGLLSLKNKIYDKSQFLTLIRSVRIKDNVYWFAQRNHNPTNKDELAAYLERGYIENELVAAVTKADTIPSFTPIEQEEIKAPMRELKLCAQGKDKIMMAINEDYEKLLLGCFNTNNHQFEVRNVTAVGQKNGEKSTINITTNEKGEIFFTWIYNNGKIKRDTRDYGIWMYRFSKYNDKLKKERINEDNDICWWNLAMDKNSSGKTVMNYTKGFSRKSAVIKCITFDNDMHIESVIELKGNPDVFLPKYLITIGSQFLFLDPYNDGQMIVLTFMMTKIK